jgi:hypothetical protein
MEVFVKSILKQSGQIITHQRELEEIRGEKFNIFSILSMETKEDATHSAFIAELLDPRGSHMMGAVFLKGFLKAIQHEDKFNVSSATVTREYYIGKVDFEKRTGGRIDILIKDNTGQTISIENKIYAGDQRFQIERYVNYNKYKNKVYYLTLTGCEPNEISKGDLNSKTDFRCLSYSNDIIDWLELCQMQAVSKPVIRESIRQYILLLKKLTHQLSDNAMEDKIIKLISSSYLPARTLANGIEKAEILAANKLLNEIEELLSDDEDENWIVETDDISKKWNGLNFWRKDIEKFWIKIEGYPFIYKTENYLGIISEDDDSYNKARKMIQQEKDYYLNFDKNPTWPCYIEIDNMNFADYEVRANLFDDSKRSQIAKDIYIRILELKEMFDKYFPI